MKQDTFKQQQTFASGKTPSMKRRKVGHDYCERQIYMITMATEGRCPLLGKIVGRSDGQMGTPDEPRVELTELGRQVVHNWQQIAVFHPEIELLALQMMPDHFHGILFVRERMKIPLGKALLGFKQGCNKSFRDLVPYVAVLQQQKNQNSSNPRRHGLLFERGYNDKILLQPGQLIRWYDYLRDNPRRLLMKREHPDLFRVQRNLQVGEYTFSAIGNRFLLNRPLLVQVQCSRSLTEKDIQTKIDEFLRLAAQGAVLVSPSISPGEKAVMRAAFEGGFPLVVLQENGFTDLAKPGGKRMEACAEGRLLILAPWQHHNERIAIQRNQCLVLNEMAHAICQGKESYLNKI